MGKSCFFPWRDLNYGSFLQQLLTHIEKSLYETLVYSDPSKIDTAESLQIVSLKNDIYMAIFYYWCAFPAE